MANLSSFSLSPSLLPLRRHLRSLLALALAAPFAAGCVPSSVGAAILVDPIRTPIMQSPSLSHRSVTFRSGDIQLSGWLFEPASKPKGLVVFLHGRMANRTWGIEAAEKLVPQGYAVLAYDQRAHGRSEGQYCTYGHLEKGDLSRAIDAVGISPAYIIGHSLGAAVALQAAAEDRRVRAVVAAAPFSDLRTVIKERAPRFASDTEVRDSIELAEHRAGFKVDDISPKVSAAHIDVPVMLLHGTLDRSIRPDHSRRILSELRGPKRLLVLEGATHYDVLRYPVVWTEIIAWLSALPSQPAPLP
jgi:uncharacterized protein